VTETGQTADTTNQRRRLGRGTLLRYRVMAYVTGVLLLLLVFVAIPVQIWGDDDTLVAILGTAHGYLYMLYLVTAFLLAYRLRWSLGRTLLLLLAGTVPFMSFVAERRVRRIVARDVDLT
jgi:integral membrane protein